NETRPPCGLEILGSNLRDVFRGLAQWSNEAITPASNRLHKPRRLGRVAQSRPKSLDRGIQTMLEVDVGVTGPEPFLQLFARHHIAGVLEQLSQHIDWLALQLNAQPV